MNKKERIAEVTVNGVPRLQDVPKDLMEAFIARLAESIEELVRANNRNEEG